MQTIKPKSKIKRVYVTATQIDGQTRKSKCITVYETTPQRVIDVLRKAASEGVNSIEPSKSAA